MIFINLLPQELRIKEVRKIHIPYRPILVVVFSIFLVLSLYNLVVYIRVRQDYRASQKQWTALADRSTQADALERELGTSILAEVDFYDSLIDPKLETARVMNLVSDLLPPGVWLTQSRFVRKKKEIQLILNGLSESLGKGSRLIEVQTFANKLKDQMEYFLISEMPQEQSVHNPIKVSLSTSSQRGDAVQGETLLFTATFETRMFGMTK